MTREEQIAFMEGAKERHDALMKRIANARLIERAKCYRMTKIIELVEKQPPVSTVP